MSGSSGFKTPSSEGPSAKKIKLKTSIVSYSSGCSVKSELTRDTRKRISKTMEDEKEGETKIIFSDNITEIENNFIVNPSLKSVEKIISNVDCAYTEAFEEILSIDWSKRSEANLQTEFKSFLSLLFKNSQQLRCKDTHERAWAYGPCLIMNDRKPDFTILRKEQPFVVFAPLFVELKINFKASQRLGYLEAYDQLRDHANGLFFNDYGQIIPRKQVWGFSADGAEFFMYKFSLAEDGLSLKHKEFDFRNSAALDMLYNIAHNYLFEPFKMEFTLINENKFIDLLKNEFIKIAIIYNSSLSRVYKLPSYILKMNGDPSFQESICIEAQVYKQISQNWKGQSNWPILTLKGEFHDIGRKKSGLLFQEEGEKLTSLAGLYQSLGDVVKFLAKLHELNYCHRDIRPANLLRFKRNGQDALLIIDFGFCCTPNVKTRYSGTYETASDRVLEQLEEGEEVSVTLADDLESLVKSVILLTYNPQLYAEPLLKLRPNKGIGKETAAKNLKEKWGDIKNDFLVKSIFDECWEIVKKQDCNKLVEEFNKMGKIQ